MRYYPYGEERWTNLSSVTDFGFTAQRSEKSFGLMDYNARYYSPVLGRFISPDSLVPDPTSSSGFNRYRYTRNNPLKYTDPSGHCVPICIVVGAALLGTALIVSTDQPINDDIVAAEAAVGSTAYRDTYPSHEQGLIGLALLIGSFVLLESIVIPPSLDDVESNDDIRPPPELIEQNNNDVRDWYHDQLKPIKELNEGWVDEGLSAEERARRAHEIRHDARVRAREMMIDRDAAQALEQRDMDQYRNPDGPTFEYLVEQNRDRGFMGDEIYEEIIRSAIRTSEEYDRKYGSNKGE